MLSSRVPLLYGSLLGPDWGSGRVGRAGILGRWVCIPTCEPSELDYPLEQKQNPPHQRLMSRPPLPRTTFLKFWKKEACVLDLTMVATFGSVAPGHATHPALL